IRQPGNQGPARAYLELSADPPNTNGTTGLLQSNTGFPYYRHRGTTDRYTTGSTVDSGVDVVLSGVGNIAAPLLNLRQNGILRGEEARVQGSGTLINAPVYLMARGTNSFHMSTRWYGGMIISRLLESSRLQKLENYFAGLKP